MNKYLLYVLIIISSFIICLAQMTFFNILGLNYLFLIIIVLLSIFNYPLALIYAFCLGVFLDLFNYGNFGQITVSLLIMAFLIRIIFLNYLTHKNFLTYLLLIVIGFIVFNFSLLLMNLIFLILGYSLEKLSWQKASFLLSQFISTILLFSTSYLLYIFFNKFFRASKK